jgi:dienelactone hydrolase
MMRSASAIVLVVLATLPLSARAQESAAVTRAKRVLDQLRQDRYEEVAKDFNAKMSAALPVAQLQQVWTSLRQQVGPLKTIVDHRENAIAGGITSVALGCEFEKATLDVVIAFDPEGRIGGLRLVPRATSAEPAAPPASSTFTEESVTIGSEWPLPGTLTLPRGAIDAAVVLVHGSGPNDRDETIGPNKPFRDLAWGLADRGIAVLRYEKRSRQHGSRLAGVAGMTVRDEVTADAVLAAALLRAHPRLNAKRVFLLGHSLGGTLAPRIAAEDRALAGIVIMAGATRPLLEAARDQLAYLAAINPAAPPVEQSLEMLRHAAPESYWKDLDGYQPARVAAALSLPILILHAGRDYQVTDADLQGWREALAGRTNVTIRTYPTLNHLFLPGEGKSTPAEYERPGSIPAFVLDDLAAWLRR